MKKYRFSGGLFVTLPPITTSCGYLTNNIKNTNNYTPPLEQAKQAQAQLLAFQTILNKKYKRKISGLLGLLCEEIKSTFDAFDFFHRAPGVLLTCNL